MESISLFALIRTASFTHGVQTGTVNLEYKEQTNKTNQLSSTCLTAMSQISPVARSTQHCSLTRARSTPGAMATTASSATKIAKIWTNPGNLILTIRSQKWPVVEVTQVSSQKGSSTCLVVGETASWAEAARWKASLHIEQSQSRLWHCKGKV